MLTTSDTTETLTQPDYVCVGTDLLSRITTRIHRLEEQNQHLTLAMTTAGHDLRQRLHALLRMVEMLTSAAGRSRSMELSERAKSLIFRLAGELEQLALRAQPDHNLAAPEACGFAIADLLGQLQKDWEDEAEAKELAFAVGQAGCVVESDQRLLAVILNNVVGNAVRHTAQGGVTVAPTLEDQFLVIAVSDTGPGIPDDAIRRSFGFSSRLRGFSEGMGLGLSIARKTAEVLGHEFSVSAGVDGGTCVRLYVPLAEPFARNLSTRECMAG
jgi:signal transduction histidine kinase